MERSGAMMAWQHFHPRTVPPLFMRYIQDRDLWRWALPHSREFSAALGSYPYDFDVWADLLFKVDELIEEGKACLRLKRQQVEIMARRERMLVFEMGGYGIRPRINVLRQGQDAPNEPWEHVVPVANATVFFSEVGERLCELHPEAPFAAYWFEAEDGAQQWGLRSRGGFDVSIIAKAFGGGGHPAAAGFRIPAARVSPWPSLETCESSEIPKQP
jgi:hypothetical protein